MYQIFSSLQGHLQFFVLFFFTFMEHFFLNTLYLVVVLCLLVRSDHGPLFVCSSAPLHTTTPIYIRAERQSLRHSETLRDPPSDFFLSPKFMKLKHMVIFFKVFLRFDC